MKFKLLKFQKLITNKKVLEKVLEKTKEFYRPFDPGSYLYKLLLDKREHLDIFSDEYIELVYTTLIGWNMNGRGAKLNEFNLFKETIKKSKDKIKLLEKYRIEKLTEEEKRKTLEITEQLFKELDLVGKSKRGKKIKSKLVTFSKTLHFILPNLIVPIDRKYTLNFFYSNKMVPTDSNIKKNDEKQIKVFNELYERFYEIATIHNLKKFIDKRWNANIPKIIDNAIIGYGIS